MFWKHFKENMKTIFHCLYCWTYSSNHYIILINNDSSLNCQGFLHGVQKSFSTKFLLVYVLEEKYQRCFLRKHGKTIPRRYQQLVRYSYNIAGKTLSFSLEMFINTKWTKNQYMKLSHLSNYQMLYQIVWFISQFSLVFSYKILKMFL